MRQVAYCAHDNAKHAYRSSSKQLTDEWLDCVSRLNGDKQGMLQAADFMEHSSAIVHDEVTPCTAIPRLFDSKTRETMRHAAQTMHSILCKVIRHYVSDPAYRTLFSFDPRLEKLILAPCGHNALLPFARYDIFLNEDTGDFVFCELNADGSSGMNEDREVARATRLTGAYSLFNRTHAIEGNELFDSWVDTFLGIYSSGAHASPTPHVAICDYLECATLSEFQEYQAAFEQHGMACSICDVRDLIVREGRLCTREGKPIDVIWRRCVTSDILSHWNESRVFINAVCDNLAMMIGGFSSHIAHDKQIFRVLRMPQTQAILTKEENEFVRRHVPYTTFLDERFIDLNEVIARKDRWVIKPTDCYGAKEVHLGIEETPQHWHDLICACANGAAGNMFLAQAFARPFRTLTTPLAEAASWAQCQQQGSPRQSPPAPRLYANLSGLYVFNGEFKGVFSRLGPNEIVTGLAGGLTAATFWVDCEQRENSPAAPCV